MLTIRLSRIGKRKQPSYRIVVLEKKKDPFGDYLELLGNYNPRTKEVNLKVERIKHWLSVGAQSSNTIHNLLVKEGVIEDKEKKKSIKITKKRQAKKEKLKTEDLKLKTGDQKTGEQKTESAEAKEESKTEEVSADKKTPPEAPKQEEKPEDKPAEEKKEEPHSPAPIADDKPAVQAEEKPEDKKD
ncbi:30S ribosomal protein S16 [Patescibacteria group bacterium]|nr:30S ribosomal protein S16 [Patescibacteria group bacterium]